MKYDETEINSTNVENDQITKSPARLVELLTFSIKIQGNVLGCIKGTFFSCSEIQLKFDLFLFSRSRKWFRALSYLKK